MKTSKKVISLILVAIMLMSNFAGLDLGLDFAVEANAAEIDEYQSQYNVTDMNTSITLSDGNWGVTQQRVVSNFASTYDGYRERFFAGRESNEATNIVIPGLSKADDFVTQGMTYWKEKDWFLISSYDANITDSTTRNSVIMAVDASSGKFVALFKLQNADGSMNTSHGGGIAASEYNFYYADSGSTISYVPLSELDVPLGTVKYLTMKGTVDFAGEMKGVATSYCCYDEGYLWAGNFYKVPTLTNSDYDDTYTDDYPSVLVGYQLTGESSEEEWANLQNPTNFVSVNAESAKTVNGSSYTVEGTDADGNPTSTQYTQSMTYTPSSTTSQDTGAMSVSISGTVSNVNNAPSKMSEFTAEFGSLSLIEGQEYTISFKSTNNKSDMYLFAPNGTHCNVKQSANSTITDNGDGTYTYSMTFTAGLKPDGADSTWPTSQSENGEYTGRYRIRFDQDNPSDGSFTLSDIKVVPVDHKLYKGYAGNPSEIVLFGGGLDNLQYAVVHDGKVYLSRSWSRTGTVAELVIGEMDLGVPGEVSLSINSKTRYCHLINATTDLTRFGNDQMFLMSEAICVVEDYIYMDMESACWKYNGGEATSCSEPIDVLWRIDQRKLLGEFREVDNASASHYEKVYDLTTLKETDEIILVHKSNLTDSFTQLPILYALDSTGGYNGNYLPKQDVSTAKVIGDNFGMIGTPLTSYSYENEDVEGDNILVINEEDDANMGMRWRIGTAADGSFRLENLHPYFSTNKYLYFGSRALTMSTNDRAALYNMHLEEYEDSETYRFYYQSKNDDGTFNNPYYLWCNDGSDRTINNAYEAYYGNHGITAYDPTYNGCNEIPGTFHTDAELGASGSSSNATGNLTGDAVPLDYQLFYIYKRVRDSYSSTYDSRIYTDLTANLQADGTYNIDLETYAINKRPLVPTEAKPIDFVLVLDTSGSMKNSDFKVLKYYYAAEGNTIKASRIARVDGNNEYGDYYKRDTEHVKQSGGNIYYVASDGTVHLLYVDFQTPNDYTGGNIFSRKYTTYIWIYYTREGITYYLQSDGSWITSTTRPGTDQCSLASEHSSQDSRGDSATFAIDHAAYDQGESRLKGMQTTVCEFIDRVSAEIAETGLDHKIAVVQYGSDGNDTNSTAWRNTGFYNTSGTTMISYNGATTAQYQTALYSQDQFEQLKTIVNSFDVTTEDPDTYVNYGFEMAKNIIVNSDSTYLSDGNRSAAVIMMTDGVPGLGKDDSNKDNVANSAIEHAYDIKHNQGGFVYSVQLGDASGDYANMGKYLDYVSSEYPAAQSLTEPGDPDIQEITYHHDVKFGDISLTNLVSNMFIDIKTNSTNSIAVLEDNTVIKERISDQFNIPEDAEINVYTQEAYYDELQRLSFKDPVKVADDTYKTSISTDESGQRKIIQINGFNYANEYVSRNRPGLTGNGKKLLVSIEGVLPHEVDNLINVPINVDEETGVYEDATHAQNNDPVKGFPVSHFSIPEYTYVLDYNLPMRDTDVNGEPLAISGNLVRQDPDNYNKSLAAAGVTDGVGLEIENNSEGKGDNLIYSLRGTDDGNIADNKGYVLIQRDDGTYDWFRINIVPASNVMYEESAFTADANKTNNWADVGEATNTHQSLSTQYDVYGYDERYDDPNGTHSNGTAKMVTVDSSANGKRSDTAKFTFTGTGFDLISTCGPTTGIQIVKLTKPDGTTKAYIVDTFYNDTTYGTLNQVPIVSCKGLEHGTYTVETTAAYLSSAGGLKAKTSANTLLNKLGLTQTTVEVDLNDSDAIYKALGMNDLIGTETEVVYMDDNSIFNGGTGVKSAKNSRAAGDSSSLTLDNYIDGIRIYEPLGEEHADYIVSEQGAEYINVVQGLSTTSDIIKGDSGFIGYGELAAGTQFTFADYKKTGAPKNEVYLSGGSSEAITFKVCEAANVMISMRAVSGQTTPNINGNIFSVNTATEMYYDITPYLGDVDTDGYYTVTIKNDTAGTLLSVNNIKVVSGGTAGHSLMALSLDDVPMITSLMSLEPVEVTPNQPQPFETKYPDYVPQTGNGAGSDAEEEDAVTPDEEPTEPETPDESIIPDFGNDRITEIIMMIFNLLQKIFSMFAA